MYALEGASIAAVNPVWARCIPFVVHAQPIPEPLLAQLIDRVNETMTAADLQGEGQVSTYLGQPFKRDARELAMFARRPLYRTPGLLKLIDVSPRKLTSLRKEHGSAAVDTVTGWIGKSRQVVAAALKQAVRIKTKDGRALNTKQAIAYVQRRLKQAGYGRDGSRIETLLRTQIALAQAIGEERALERLEVWGFEYVTMRDDRVRPGHAAMDGMRLPKDDPRWQTMTPPCGFNCRCRRIPIMHAVRPKGPRKGAAVDTGFGQPANAIARQLVNL